MSLPLAFQREGSPRGSSRNPFEQDFLISTRLNHLHVLFLLHLLYLSCPTDPNPKFVEISEEMLSLVVEAMILRGQVINSGTSLVWKVSNLCRPLLPGWVFFLSFSAFRPC